MEIIYKGNPIAGGGLSVLSMTKAEYLANQAVYDASDNIIEITDDDDLAISGEQIAFNNTGTGLSATNVQGAIEEVNTKASIWDNPVVGSIDTSYYTAYRVTNVGRVTKYGNLVHLELSLQFTNSITIPTATAFATIPAAYRPNTSRTCVAQESAGSDPHLFVGYITILADGTITQGGTSTMSSITCDCWYTI